MTETTIRVLEESDWNAYRSARLRALKESPEGFAAAYKDEVDFGDEIWHDRMTRATRLLAERGPETVGIVSVRADHKLFDNAAEVFGLWVPVALRGAGIAAALVQGAAHMAGNNGHVQLIYWVGTENARGVAFASSFGFRPTEHRRPMQVSTGEGEQEIALTLALGR